MPARVHILIALSACVGITLTAPTARACGGLFCSAAAPVNQAAERIIFADHGDGTVTAVVQIQYSGPSERFAWVLPVPGVPDVQVSSDLAFTRLQQASNPQYILNTTIDGVCRQESFGGFFTTSTTAPSFAFADAGAASPVTVVASGNVGPYDYEVIHLDPSTERPGDVAVAWFATNGYDVSGFGADSLGSYLLMGMNLIAFRLTKGNSAGTIRPIRMRYEASCPMIPIRPTAVATTDDMGVMVWVLGPSRAVPTNYLSLELNEAALDWINGGSNYNAVVTQAANEAGGQGFVTEHAVPSAGAYGTAVFQEWEGIRAADLHSLATSGELIAELVRRYAAWDGLAGVIAPWFVEPLDEAALTAVLQSCQFFCSPNILPDVRPMTPADHATLLAALERDVLGPMRATQQLFLDTAFVTRLYTTLSASEMTLDPTFDFNPELPSVDNVHMANRVIFCSSSVTFADAPWLAHLPGGDEVYGEGSAWPYAAGDLPAMRKAVQLATAGTGVLMLDQSEVIDARLAADRAGELRPWRATCQAGPPSGLHESPQESAPWAVLCGLLAGGALLARRRGSRGSRA